MTEIPEFEPLTEHRRRARSLSEPRSFLGSAVELSPHAETVPSTPTEYIFAADDLNSRPRSSQTISPPPRQSSLVPSPNIRMPEDVYFTAAGRRESRMYISPDAAPNFVPAVPQAPMRRGHTHSNSEPVLLDRPTPAMRHATWSGAKKEPTSGRPFEDVLREEASSGEKDNTPVSRKEDMWSGNWNRDDIQDVIQGLRLLK
ncbi:hypothetical protein DFH06DRAFT_1200854 [Mycena polygramma]|nr:hypothetical protein DFH06DRAFT_1200854 [Mycena polygramma]